MTDPRPVLTLALLDEAVRACASGRKGFPDDPWDLVVDQRLLDELGASEGLVVLASLVGYCRLVLHPIEEFGRRRRELCNHLNSPNRTTS